MWAARRVQVPHQNSCHSNPHSRCSNGPNSQLYPSFFFNRWGVSRCKDSWKNNLVYFSVLLILFCLGLETTISVVRLITINFYRSETKKACCKPMYLHVLDYRTKNKIICMEDGVLVWILEREPENAVYKSASFRWERDFGDRFPSSRKLRRLRIAQTSPFWSSICRSTSLISVGWSTRKSKQTHQGKTATSWNSFDKKTHARTNTEQLQ